MLAFKVYAGTMFCGKLYVVTGFSHSFIAVNGSYITSANPINRVAGYKQLRLVRYI